MTSKPSKIYLVDDDADLRAATAQWLELADYQVETFSDAPSALARIRPDMSAVVVSDVKMPKMDGMEFLARLTALDKDLPVVLITAHGELRQAVEAHKELTTKLDQLERKLTQHDGQILSLVEAIRRLAEPSEVPERRRIGFETK